MGKANILAVSSVNGWAAVWAIVGAGDTGIRSLRVAMARCQRMTPDFFYLLGDRLRAYPNNGVLATMSIVHWDLCLDDWRYAETLPWTNDPSPTIGVSPMISGRPSLCCFPNIKTPTASVADGPASPTASVWKPSSTCYAPAANGKPWTPPSSAPLPPPTTAFRSGSRPASSRNYGSTA